MTTEQGEAGEAWHGMFHNVGKESIKKHESSDHPPPKQKKSFCKHSASFSFYKKVFSCRRGVTPRPVCRHVRKSSFFIDVFPKKKDSCTVKKCDIYACLNASNEPNPPPHPLFIYIYSLFHNSLRLFIEQFN